MQIQQLIAYVVRGNPQGVKDLIRNYGYDKPLTNEQGLYNGLVYLYKTNKSQTLIDLARIHPDKDLVVDVNCPGKGSAKGHALANADGTGEKESCCGCSAADGYSNCCAANGSSSCSGMSSCDGNKKCSACAKGNTSSADGVVTTSKNWLNDNFPALVVGGVIGVAIFLIVRGNK